MKGALTGHEPRPVASRPIRWGGGAYQIRTTGSGEPPTDADLLRVIDEGIPGTAMPGWKGKLPAEERRLLVDYIKGLADVFTGPPGAAVAVGPQPPASPAGLTEGRSAFDKMECFKCHGTEGRGDGPSAPKLKDDLGFPIRPADLTRGWLFNGGDRTEDVYLRLRTGLDGTPMPSFSDVMESGIISEDQLWRLAQYVRSLSPDRSPLGDLEIRLRRVTEDRTVAASDSIGFSGGVRTDSLPRARFPHWVHRIRYRCKACHTQLFEPKAGANAVTMKAISNGQFCGRCHDGQTAFRAGFGQCERCHTPVLRAAPYADARGAELGGNKKTEGGTAPDSALTVRKSMR